jgi:hypothetical protein
MEIGNLKSKANGGGTIVANNIINGYDTVGDRAAVYFRVTGSLANPQQDVGLNDLTVAGNTIYGWTKGLELESGFDPSSTGPTALSNLTVSYNDIQGLTSTPLLNHGSFVESTTERWISNRYDCTPAAVGAFSVMSVDTNFNTWHDRLDYSAEAIHLGYADPTRTAATYSATVGGAATLDGFLSLARSQTKAKWDARYGAKAVVNYETGGFTVVG